MPLQPGDAYGPYVIEAPAGTGGMGEVYKARDTRLHRTVAVKVIGSRLGDSPEARQRFASEARTIAALNHPHICTLFDTGHQDGKDFLVLEYLEGESLAESLQRGRINPAQMLEWGIQIADALDYAHRQGIVHRDLKPANVYITRQSRAKLLDFGLAKLRVATSEAAGLSGLATAPVPHTAEAAILGTLHYLAPERLDGREADARSDVFAFGAVLYEMATRRKAFDEPTQARLIASIVSTDPPPINAAAGVPAGLQWVVQNCLAKDPDARWQSMGDVAKVLRMLARAEPLPVAAKRRRHWLAISAAMLAAAALGASLTWSRSPSPTPASASTVYSVFPPADGAFGLTASSVKAAQFALAPDGQAIVFVAMSKRGESQLWIRESGRLEPQPLQGTTGASYPFWSPDSRFIGFFADGLLKKVGLTGRPPQQICEAQNGRGGTWRADNTIVFSGDVEAPLSRVDASGLHPARPVTSPAEPHLTHRWPQFLPDGRVLFFVRASDPAAQGAYVVSLEKPSNLHKVRSSGTSNLFASGHLLYEHEGELMAQPFDPTTLDFSGEALPLGLEVGVSSALNVVASASANGRLATWSSSKPSELVWFDQGGNRQGTVGKPDRYVDFRLAPDERDIAVSRVDPVRNRSDLAILNLATGGLTKLSSSPQTDASPLWSTDGTRLVFRSNRWGQHDLFEAPARGGEGKLLFSNGLGLYPTDWSANDGLILFHFLSASTKHDIWSLDPRDPQSSARPVAASPAIEAQGQLGPGGRLAYTSDESGTLNVHIRTLDHRTPPINVSVNGGFDPRWKADGRELFFISESGKVMAAELSPNDRLQVVHVRELFTSPVQDTGPPYLSSYVVKKDGSRFLFNVPAQQQGEQPITLTVDWPSRMKSDSR